MPTIIDSLLVTLGLDPRGYKKGAKEAEDAHNSLGRGSSKVNKELQAQLKKSQDAVATLRNEVLRMAAVFVGMSAIKSFIESSTKFDAATGRMAKTLDMSTEGLSTWQQVAEQMGVSGQAVAGDMDKLTQSLERFSATGEGGDNFRFFRALNVQISKLGSQEARDARDVLLDVADAFKGMDPKRAKMMGLGMGFSPETISMLLKGRKELEGALDRARSTALSEDDVRAAQDRQKAWAELEQTFGRLARDVENELTPSMVGLANFVKQHAPETAFAISAITASMTALSAVRFIGLISSLRGLTAAAKAASATAAVAEGAGAVGGLGGLAGARAGLAGMGLLGQANIYAGAAVGATEIARLGVLLKEWWDVEHRQGAKLTPDAAARLAQLNAAGGSAVPTTGDSGSKQEYLRSLEQKWGLPAGLLDSVWQEESGRGQHMVSPKGAMGDFQQMPATARAYGITDPMNFQQSASAAARMLADLLRQYGGNLPTTLAAYNFGSGNLQRSGGALPLETQKYVRDIMGRLRGSGGSGTNNETTIENMTIVTQATDARGIARDMQPALIAAQANTGMF
ncbi:MAG TPA: lytic transglycosylase domain-containing protein [Burkholderiaceae bacterium]